MTPCRRFLLAAHDARLALEICTHLQRALQLVPLVVRMADVDQLLTPETDGQILLVVGDPTDVTAVETVVRETRVRQFPVGLAVVETELVRDLRLLDGLEPYLAGRWTWPHHNRDVTAWACQALGPGNPFPDPETETLTERLRRRLINQTPSLTSWINQLCVAAQHDVTVLIEGEPGTGKTFLAKLLHDHSPRAGGRFVTMSCNALNGTQLAGELYGYTRFAPTLSGGEILKPGKLALAEEGSLFLDEIDALDAEHQAGLLRVLEMGEYEPVDDPSPRPCKTRVFAATHGSLMEAVEQGRFRRDLYYRLSVLSFQLPPLRHRPEDISPLVRSLVARYGTKFGKKLYAVSPEALRMLEAYSWPGNIRQLENVVQQAVLTASGSELKPHHLPPMIHAEIEAPVARSSPQFGIAGTLRQSRESIERANILRALEQVGYSRTRAAQLLGVSRVTLYKKMKKYGLLTAIGYHPATERDSFEPRNGRV